VTRYAERPVLFGRDDSLVGILTRPLERGTPGGGRPPDPTPTLVLLNSGIIHRVGPNRLYVLLARRLAAEGFTTLRFDLSGLGDSKVAWDPEATDPQGMTDRDVRLALDWLDGVGSGEGGYVLAGLCSGADNARRAAFRDPRIVGAIMIDPDVYRTPGYWLRHIGKRLLRGRTWRNVLTLQHPWIRSALGGEEEAEEAVTASAMTVTRLPGREELEEQHRELVGRGVRLFYLFSGGLEVRYNYRDQLLDGLRGVDFEDCLTLEYHGESDHTFSRPEYQRSVLHSMVDWVRSTSFEAPARRTEPTGASADG